MVRSGLSWLFRFAQTDGSGHAIRYWPREERWLIDLDGLMLGRQG